MDLDFEPELPSRAPRGPGLGRSLAGWLVGLVVLAVVGGIAVFLVQRYGNQPLVDPQAVAEKTSGSHAETVATSPDSESNETTKTPTNSSSDLQPSTSPSPTAPVAPKTPSKSVSVKPAPRYKDVLKGELTQDRTLSAAKSPYHLQGTVVVRQRVSLAIEDGVEIVAAPYAELIVHGNLLTSGTQDSPVRFHAEQGSPGAWKGIRAQGDFSEARLRGTVISDAEAAFTLAGFAEPDRTKFLIESCLLHQNQVGLKLENFSSVRVTNSAIVRNRDDGVSAREDDGVYRRVTIAGNGGKGYVCLGKPAPQFDECSIVGNEKGGVHCGTAGEAFRARWSASKSNLFANGPFDVFNENPSGVLLGGNFWGSATTRELQVLGDNTKKKQRGRIWDGLHPKHRGQGIVIASNFASEFLSSSVADAAVLALSGSEPLDVASWLTPTRKRKPGSRETPNAPEVPPLFVDIAEQLRELLSVRRYDEAAALLDESAADPDLKPVAELIHGAQEDVRLIQELWSLAAAKIAALQPGAPMSIAGIRGELVSYQDGQVTIRVDTVTRSSAFSALRPPDVIFLAAGGKEPSDPELVIKVWVFLLADKQGTDSEVDHWTGLATRSKADLNGRGVYLIPKGKRATTSEEK